MLLHPIQTRQPSGYISALRLCCLTRTCAMYFEHSVYFCVE
nr:MAG TPA: hypothetical protein [Caudoviricetes sp.]